MDKTKKRRKKKEFRPNKIPRYLLGSVRKAVWKADLKEYNKHRYNLFTAVARGDYSSPHLDLNPYFKQRRIRDDSARLAQIDKSNKSLLRAINTVNRTTGRVNCFNPQAYVDRSKWKLHEKKMRVVEKHNKEIHAMLNSVQSDYGRAVTRKFWNRMVGNLKSTCKYPLHFEHKVTADMLLARQPSISGDLEKTGERMFCFLEFKVQDGPILGRVYVELYHDHVPVTVQNFISICKGEGEHSYKGCPVHRIIPGKCIETGDITKGNGKGGASIYGKSFHEEGHKLKHTKAGVLSMIRIGKRRNNSQFCITFAPAELLDRRNVVFGKIIGGVGNFFKLEGYGRRIGKPLAPIVISDCGNVLEYNATHKEFSSVRVHVDDLHNCKCRPCSNKKCSVKQRSSRTSASGGPSSPKTSLVE